MPDPLSYYELSDEQLAQLNRLIDIEHDLRDLVTAAVLKQGGIEYRMAKRMLAKRMSTMSLVLQQINAEMDRLEAMINLAST